MRGAIVDTRAETVSLPEDKILKARLLSPDTFFDPGMARIPTNLIQQLRGEMEFWGSRILQIRTEFAPVDRMLHSINGVAFPKGNSCEAKANFREILESVEFLRALFGSSHDIETPFYPLFGRTLLTRTIPLPQHPRTTCLDRLGRHAHGLCVGVFYK